MNKSGILNNVYVSEESLQSWVDSADNASLGEPKTEGIIDSIKKLATISRILRIIGASTVIASMSAFLLQDWSVGSDINRFYLLLVQTLLLALAGLGLSFLLKENKGARVFFGLGLLSITANLTTLGALIFSTVQWGGNLSDYPAFATWQAASFSAVSFSIVSALAVAIPIAVFAYMVMARKSAKALAITFLLTNVLLLMPVRDSLFVGILALLGAVLPFLMLRKHILRDTGLRTFEGRFALATLFLPVVILVVRSIWLYQFNDFLHLTLALIAYVGLYLCSQPFLESSAVKRSLDWMSVGVSGIIAYTATQLIDGVLPFNVNLAFFGVLFSVFTLEVARRAGRNQRTFTCFAGIVLSAFSGMQLMVFGGVLSATLCLFAGAGTLILGKMVEQKNLFLLGLVTALWGFGYQTYNVFESVDFTSWITLALIGVSTIVIASLLERFGTVLKLKWAQWLPASSSVRSE